jgi:hypothetical protein
MNRSPTLVACLVAFAPGAGCFLSTDSSNTTSTAPTLLTVDPLSFRGPVRCAPGELRLYSVTLTDVTPPLAGFEPPDPFPVSSGLVPCNELVMFAGGRHLVDAGRPLEIGHYYVGRIDGFDTEDVALVQTDAGVTEPQRLSTHEPVAPHWTTTCGEPSFFAALDAGPQDGGDAAPAPVDAFRRPTLIVDSVSIRLQGCVPFDRSPAPTDAGTADSGADADASADGGT